MHEKKHPLRDGPEAPKAVVAEANRKKVEERRRQERVRGGKEAVLAAGQLIQGVFANLAGGRHAHALSQR